MGAGAAAGAPCASTPGQTYGQAAAAILARAATGPYLLGELFFSAVRFARDPGFESTSLCEPEFKQEKRWRKDGSEPEAEALSKGQEADPVEWKCRAAVLQQNPLRSPQ
jgi:hypothetical protein